ncbi:MAG: TlpA family protein disulfide reductase [Mesonia hippocampi]|uniref:TlpA family protein disulfide reductase n=1 Tax=Mesonia hippocampi TaxID=1628250 RepID=UPI003F94B27A
MKKVNIKKILNYGFWIAFVVVLFTGSLRAEVFGFIQRGLLEIGIMNPDTEQALESKTPASYQMKVKNQNGEQIDFNDLKGKVVFINFWATWCPPCVAEMPSINNLYKKFENDKDVVFIMVSLDDKFEKAKNFKKRKNFSFDVHQLSSNLPSVYRSASIPTTFVLDAQGNIAFTHKGMANYDTQKFEDMLNSLK